MKEAGCDLLITTLDSGDDAILERLGKPFRTEDTVTCVRACQEAGLNADLLPDPRRPGRDDGHRAEDPP